MRPMTFGWIAAISVWFTFLLAVVRGIVAWERECVPDDAGYLASPPTAEQMEPAGEATLRPVA